MEDQIELDLPAGPDAACAARSAVTQRFRARVAEKAMDDVRLLVTELITNALRHAGLHPGDRVLLRARLADDSMRVEVHDPGRNGEVEPREPKGRGGGYGLFLLEQIAQRWGVERGSGTVVWFEMPAGPAR